MPQVNSTPLEQGDITRAEEKAKAALQGLLCSDAAISRRQWPVIEVLMRRNDGRISEASHTSLRVGFAQGTSFGGITRHFAAVLARIHGEYIQDSRYAY